MAGRKDKNTVDYFPHFCESGKTLFIIENQFKHVGYSVWFKTLELLGTSENHYIDLRDESDLLFLISKLKITESQLTDIYNLCAKLGAIDIDLWNNKIVYSENFVKNIEDAYKRRLNKCMNKLDLCKHLSIECSNKSNLSKHKSTKESKVNKSKVNPTLTEIDEYGKSKGYKLPCQKIIDHYTNGGELDYWIDTNNKNVQRWKGKLSSVWLKDEYKIKQECNGIALKEIK